MGRWAIAVHGGAGVDPNLPDAPQQRAKSLLSHCLIVGTEALKSGARAIDVVESIVRVLESDPLFNSGRGSALSRNGTVEMEASIMDGSGRRCGAVSGVRTVKNPISLARLVMDKSPHCYLGFDGAEEFARDQGVETVDNDYFITEENIGMLKLAKEANTIMFDYRIPLPETCSATAGSAMATSDSSLHMNGLPIGIYAPETVGCVVVDSYGNCAAATSTGGLMNKMNGRIWDSPLIGAGSYACDICAVSCTGEGEAIIRSTLAREVGALMEYKGVGLQEAVDFVIKETLNKGGYLIGNLQPAHMDFRFFSLGNIWAIVSSLTTPKQAEGILSLMEEKWDDFVGDMPLKICYPALEYEEWRIITGCDPKNTPWSYHNGGSWPTLLWQFTLACIKMGRPELARKAVSVAEKKLSKDKWPEYYDTRAGRFIGKQSRLYQTWTIAGYLTSKMLLENPEMASILTCDEDLELLEGCACSLSKSPRTKCSRPAAKSHMLS